MLANVKISPAVCAACGAAFAFYCLFPIYRQGFIGIDALLVLAFVPVAALCLFRVIASWPLAGEGQQTFRLIRLVSLGATAFVAGLALGIGAGTRVQPAISFGIPEDTVAGVTGILLDDPRIVSGGRAMSTLSLKMAMGERGVRTSARGEITVFFMEESAERLKEFGRGAEVLAEGNLRAGKGGFEGSYVLAAETLHVTRPAPPLERFRTGLRLSLTRRFAASSEDGAWGGMALALLLGIRDNLDTGIASLYRNAGCSHILALSGMHLAGLVAVISFLLKKPLGLRPAALVGAAIIVAYCFVVGPLPSLNRAALMYLLGVLAVIGMLKRDALSILCIAFVIQLVITPQAGLSLSFILSYLALAGILTVGELINSFFKGQLPAFVLQPVAASVGAFIATAGVSAWFFNDLRPVGIIASLVLTPLTTLFMVGSMAWLGLDLALPSLSFLLGKPLSLLYWLMEKAALAASYLPGIRANQYLIISLSLFSIAVLAWLEHRRSRIAGRLDPFPV
ncbi:MAG: ComEC/Rec2 family competence protein [Treponema sp.]|jgi:competence protein ComEC|nr:ComEC/Rec2 family competence protein [Treponema sp.]